MNITTETRYNDRVTAKGGGKQATIDLLVSDAYDSERHAEAAAIVARKHGLTTAVSCEKVNETTLRFTVS